AAELGLDRGRGRREGMVGRSRRQHDQVDFARRDAGVGQRRAGRRGGQRAGRLALARDVARADAGTLANPLVAGVDSLGQLVVGHAPGGERRAGALEYGTDQLEAPTLPLSRRRCSPSSARSAAMRSVRLSSSSRAATATALATPAALAPPCDFTITPLRPRKTAPLWLFGSRWWRSSSVAGRDTRKPIFERSDERKAFLSRSVTNRAAPSIAFRAMLPEKPSVTTTSKSPRLILSAST